MTNCISDQLLWWITMIEIPALSALFWLIWQTRKEHESNLRMMSDQLDMRQAQIREGLSAYKLEVAKTYAQVSDLRELENRLTSHLLRIEAKLEREYHEKRQ